MPQSTMTAAMAVVQGTIDALQDPLCASTFDSSAGPGFEPSCDLTENPDLPEESPATVGLFGLLGQGNIGNDASMEAVVAFLQADHPRLTVDAMCTGPKYLTAHYGISAVNLRWFDARKPRPRYLTTLAKSAGKLIDGVRIFSWVRKHDVVIVPGMGVLEATDLPQKPFQTPYSMFLMCAAGRLFRTRVALVSVGASATDRRLTRWFITSAARLAYYRSFRDEPSRNALQQMNLNTSADGVFPDLVFSLPVPEIQSVIPSCVGVGVMDYAGSNDDRKEGRAIRESYVAHMTRIILWLLESGRTVRILTGDVHDDAIATRIIRDVQEVRPDLPTSAITASPTSSVKDLLRQLATVELVIATRYHNVLCALMLAKPTISVGYGEKFEALMARMEMSDYCQDARSIGIHLLIRQFSQLDRHAPEIKARLVERNAAIRLQLCQQFQVLSEVLLASAKRRPRPRLRRSVPVAAVGSTRRGAYHR
jgi:polysaccharide pyruvyl transferase WcaK-like protein